LLLKISTQRTHQTNLATFLIIGSPVSPLIRSLFPKYVISIYLMIFSTVIFSPLELLAALFILGIIFQVCRNIYWAIKRRVSAIFERRRIKRAPELGNVTTELGTAPGEARSDP